MVNRSMDEACEMDFVLSGFEAYKVVQHVALEGDDLKAVNTADAPNTVVPVEKEILDKISLAPHSWNMIVMRKEV